MKGYAKRRLMSALLPLFLSLCFFAVLSSTAHAAPRTIDGVVMKVADGDTVTVITTDGRKARVRLYGIDAPEIPHGRKQPGQPFGEEAKRALTEKVFRQRVTVDVQDVDRYKRIVGVLRIGSRNVNEEMVAEGWAWAYREYLRGPYASEFIDVERRARENRIGLWKQNNPQPPWEYRRQARAR